MVVFDFHLSWRTYRSGQSSILRRFSYRHSYPNRFFLPFFNGDIPASLGDTTGFDRPGQQLLSSQAEPPERLFGSMIGRDRGWEHGGEPSRSCFLGL